MLTLLVDNHERRHYPIPAADAISVVRLVIGIRGLHSAISFRLTPYVSKSAHQRQNGLRKNARPGRKDVPQGLKSVCENQDLRF